MDTSKPLTPADIVAASPEDIASLTTRHIHSMFKRWRVTEAHIGYEHSIYDTDPTAGDKQLGKAVRILREELVKRPHVPNKKEAKELRRIAAKRGR